MKLTKRLDTLQYKCRAVILTTKWYSIVKKFLQIYQKLLNKGATCPSKIFMSYILKYSPNLSSYDTPALVYIIFVLRYGSVYILLSIKKNDRLGQMGSSGKNKHLSFFLLICIILPITSKNTKIQIFSSFITTS